MMPWTIACLAPLSMEFPRQEYWSRLPFLSPEDRPDPGIELASPAWQADYLQLNHLGSPSRASVQFSRSVMSDSLRRHESQHARPPCPSPTPGVHPDSHFVPYVYIKICHWSCHNAVVKRPANPEQWKRSVVFLASYVHFRMIITPFPSLTSKCPRDLVCMFAAFCMVSGVSSHCVIVHIWPNES